MVRKAALLTLFALAFFYPQPAQAKDSKRIQLGFFAGNSRARQQVPARRWEPGHYEIREERVWVPGEAQRVWVPAVIQRRRLGHLVVERVLREGYYREEVIPGHWQVRRVQVWVPGRWVVVPRRPAHGGGHKPPARSDGRRDFGRTLGAFISFAWK